jgi:hypothetical protein
MKKLALFYCLLFLLISINLPGQNTNLSAKILSQLDTIEKEMVNALSNGDSAAFKKIAGNDYLDINANGTMMTLRSMLADIPNYKGFSVNFSEKSQRVYGNFVLRNGKAKFYAGNQQLGEVFYTQGWVYRDKRWQFVHWQGTTAKDFGQAK